MDNFQLDEHGGESQKPTAARASAGFKSGDQHGTTSQGVKGMDAKALSDSAAGGLPTRGMAIHEVHGTFSPLEFHRRAAREHDIVIDIKYCGVCHSDIHLVNGEWPGSVYPLIPGHEIAGIVRSTGTEATRFRAGDRVGVGCYVDSCRSCARCKAGLEQHCKDCRLTYNGKEPGTESATLGGYSTVIVVDENYVYRIPESLPLAEAAPLLCAGITVYSPLKRGGAGPGKKVGVVGLGGLGHVAIKIGCALGAEVVAFSRSEAKREDALRLGAKGYIVTADSSVFTEHAEEFDLIINTVSAGIDVNDYVTLLKVGGSIFVVGVGDKPLEVQPFPLIMHQGSVSGSLTGGLKETQEMLDFCGEHGITADIELISPQDLNTAYARVLKSDVRYRFVVDNSKL